MSVIIVKYWKETIKKEIEGSEDEAGKSDKENSLESNSYTL